MTALFPDAGQSVDLANQIRCVEREVRMRERVYPRWVASGKMTAPAADRELAAMRAVLSTLLSLRDAGR